MDMSIAVHVHGQPAKFGGLFSWPAACWGRRMPSVEHEVVAELVSRQPGLLRALAELAGVQLPRWETLERVDSDLSRVAPVELRADKVLVCRNAEGDVQASLVFEIQRRPDHDKPYAWPGYVASLRLQHRSPALLFVVAMTGAVERWASRPIDLGGGNTFRPIVIGPSLVPKLTEAGDDWELAILSALMHARSRQGPEIAAAALLAAREHADEADQALYFDLISSKLTRVARAVLREKMIHKHYEPQTAFSRHWKRVGLQEGLKEGLKEGREAGREEGLQEGREEGREGLVRAVLSILDARGLRLSAAAERELAALRDLAALADTARRAAIVESADALFARAPVRASRSKRR